MKGSKRETWLVGAPLIQARDQSHSSSSFVWLQTPSQARHSRPSSAISSNRTETPATIKHGLPFQRDRHVCTLHPAPYIP